MPNGIQLDLEYLGKFKNMDAIKSLFRDSILAEDMRSLYNEIKNNMVSNH